MAPFLANICEFVNCGRIFPSLPELIIHIEDTHIDYDPVVIEQKEASQPSCLHLSYVLRFRVDREPFKANNATLHSDVRRRLASVVKPSSVRSNTPTGSEFDDEEMNSQSEDSNDSWTVSEEFSSEYILRLGSNRSTTSNSNGGPNGCEKPFACPVPGCKKRYKNVNGIKYHSKNGHKKEGKVRKKFKCNCGKYYKTAQGLRNHTISFHHNSQPLSPAMLKPISIPVMKALQGFVGNHQNQADNSKTMRTFLENNGNQKMLTLPKSAIGNMQINIPSFPLIHKFETDPSCGNDGKPSQSYVDNSLLPNGTCALTPASSPISNQSDQVIRLAKDVLASHGVQMPLTPVTPSSETHSQLF